jgi:hypothetical protein
MARIHIIEADATDIDAALARSAQINAGRHHVAYVVERGTHHHWRGHYVSGDRTALAAHQAQAIHRLAGGGAGGRITTRVGIEIDGTEQPGMRHEFVASASGAFDFRLTEAALSCTAGTPSGEWQLQVFSANAWVPVTEPTLALELNFLPIAAKFSATITANVLMVTSGAVDGVGHRCSCSTSSAAVLDFIVESCSH